jgi:hypothetical protein
MPDSVDAKGKNFTAFRSAREEVEMRADMQSEEQGWDNEGGYFSSSEGSVRHVPGADLPYIVALTHQGRAPTNYSFATMREAEAFIKRNSPMPGRTLSQLYDRPAGDS